MDKWLDSVYSDGTGEFVSSPAPRMGETVQVRLRVLDGAPVKRVFLRSLHNGLQSFTEMERRKALHGLRYYEAPLPINEPRVEYCFCIAATDATYYYTQMGITGYVPDHICNFALLSDYVQPEWVRDTVFYQIFPERFCNGDPSNDVTTGEYYVGGCPALHREWDDQVLDYQQGRCMDFYGGDLEGVRLKLPYLKKLGVTALYLNPIFAGPSVHKYDCVDYFHVDPHFGGDDALAELTRDAHEQGIRVVLDISINHTGSNHLWFNKDGVFFPKTVGAYNNPESPERSFYYFNEDGSYHGWYGNAHMPTLNYTSQKLRDAVYRAQDSVLRKWLKPPYNIDGWRFDVADTFGRHDSIQLAHTLWPEIRRAIREENPQAYILAEDWGDCAQYLQGTEWDSTMNYFGCARVIREFLGQRDLFLHPLLRSEKKMTGEDVKARVMQHLAKLPWVIRENQFNLIDSHDVPRLHNDPAIDSRARKAAAIFQFILPGAASIYYGDEADIGGTVDSNEGCRWPMPWDKEIEETEGYRLYHAMCSLKAAHRALREGGMKFIFAKGPVFAIARFTLEEAFVAVLSNSDREETAELPLCEIGARMPENGADVFGNTVGFTPVSTGAVLTLPPHAALLFNCPMV